MRSIRSSWHLPERIVALRAVRTRFGWHGGAAWKSSTHIDVVGLEFNIWLGNAEGEEQIMRDGVFLLEA